MDGWDGWAIENERGEARNFTGAKAKAKVLLLTVWEVGRQFKKSQTQNNVRLDELNMKKKIK